MDTEIIIGDDTVTFEDALEEESDMLCMIDDAHLDEEQRRNFEAHEHQITQLVGHHLCVQSSQCQVLDKSIWESGRFNLCIPVAVRRPGQPDTAVAFRCPKVHRIKTTLDEKLRAEIGSQVWIDEHCPNIRIPHLFGFQLANGLQFTHSRHRPAIQRFFHTLIQKIRQWLSLPLLSAYIRTQSRDQSNSIGPYMVSEWVQLPGSQLLSNTWSIEKDNVEKRENLFRGIARIVLDLARIPQPRVGSLQFNDNGTVSLSGRYLNRAMAHYENQGTKQVIPPGTTYDCSDSFVADLTTMRLERCLSPQSRAFDQRFTIERIAITSLLRAMSGRYLERERRHGPYVLQLSDLHWGNVFVDSDWNVTYLIDLEWINATPAELQMIPSGLLYDTRGVAEGDDKLVSCFKEVFAQFCAILRKEEADMKMEHDISISERMASSWSNGLFWFWYGLSSEEGMDTICDTVEPYYSILRHNRAVLARYVVPDMSDILQKKDEEFANYKKELRARFDVPPDTVLPGEKGSTNKNKQMA